MQGEASLNKIFFTVDNTLESFSLFQVMALLFVYKEWSFCVAFLLKLSVQACYGSPTPFPIISLFFVLKNNNGGKYIKEDTNISSFLCPSNLSSLLFLILVLGFSLGGRTL